jgi:hypothetical protein
MPKNVAVLLYVVFAAFALLSKLGGGIDQIAHAQLPPFSPPIENQNQNANNLPFNSNNPIQPGNVKPSISSNCMTTSSSEGRNVSCGTNQNQNQNQNTDNLPLNNNNPIQPTNVKPSMSSGTPIENQNQHADYLQSDKNAIQTSSVKQSMSSDCMAISSSLGRDLTI